MELGQMSVVEGFIAEDTIDGEEFARTKRLLLSDHLEVP
jgi:hypothetical protein